MRLPNGHKTELATMLDDYVLNAFHPEGKHKARVFESALGIGLWNGEVPSRALLQIARDSNEFLQVADNDHGNTYVLRFRLANERPRYRVERLDHTP